MLEPAAPPSKSPPLKKRLAQIVSSPIFRAVVFSLIVIFTIREGLALRRWMYPATETFRFNFDINNAWRQGMGVVDDARQLDPKADHVSFGKLMSAYLARYGQVMTNRPEGDYQLDYPPARLLIMSIWVWHETDHGKPQPAEVRVFGLRLGPGNSLPSPAELAGPLLNVNTVFELLAFAGAFMLTRAVLRRQQFKHADFIALGPAILVWFNPAVLLDAHAWPQWDAWILPFWLWAGYFAVTRRWIAAGACLGFGAMFKGQIFLTIPFFILWPLFQFQFRRLLDVLLGILLGMMLYVWPWLLLETKARIVVVVAITITLIVHYWLPRRWRMTIVCGVAGSAVLLAGLLLGGDFAWWHVGFEYGTNRYMSMTMGPAPNLAQSLAGDFGWGLTDVLYTVNWPHPAIQFDITMQKALVALYALALVICSIGAALQDARGDRRLLLAIAAPWVAMFAFLPEMHDRYLVWGAALTALAAGVSLGSTLLHLTITFIACVPIAMNMIGFKGLQRDYPVLYDFLSHACNNTAWMTVLLAGVVIYLSLSSSRKDRRSVGPTVGGGGWVGG